MASRKSPPERAVHRLLRGPSWWSHCRPWRQNSWCIKTSTERSIHNSILYYIILYYITLYYITLYYIILYYIILHYIILYYIILFYISLYSIILHYIILYYITLYYITYIILYIYRLECFGVEFSTADCR